MDKKLLSSAPLALALGLLASGASGCDDGNAKALDGSVYTDMAGGAATVQGYVWDAEAYWLAFAACGQSCQLPPLILPASPLFAAAAISGAHAGLFDPLTPMMPLAIAADAPSEVGGGFNVENVPLRPAPPYFPVVGGVTPADSDAGVPSVGYFPTLTLRPVSTADSTLCLGMPAGVATDSGVLEAVAKYLTAKGTPTTAADLSDPTKSGGVVIWWLFIPGASALRVPAFGSFVTSDVGTSYNIMWLPPEAGSHIPFVAPIQSKRGFFVSNDVGKFFTDPDPTKNPPSPGVTVTVLPPLMGPPPSVQFTFTDPVPAVAGGGHPYQYRPLAPIQVGPGAVTYGESQALTPGPSAGAPPSWLCLP